MKQDLVVFNTWKIRRIRDEKNETWYFSVIDVVWVLSWSDRPRKYRNDLKMKLTKEWSEVSEKIGQLKLIASDGKGYLTDTADTQTIFRIIQTIPSPNAEPFKLWLAKVWYERVQEIENPELAQDRMKEIYKQKWYPKEWIDKRVRGIAIRQNLTDERKERWIQAKSDFAILTAEISKATFGMTPSEYKEHKWLSNKKNNLRDHMTDLELIFTMLGESVTTEISKQEQPKWFPQNKKVANRGGSVAWKARKETEKELWKSIISDQNYLWWDSENFLSEK